MNLLAFDTATDACSVALALHGAVAQRHVLCPQGHTQQLLPMVQALCAEAGITPAALDGIAVGIGPGAFTGVRIASALAQGLALAHGLPVVGISTLAALARGGWRLTGHAHWLLAVDARRQEVYWGHAEITAGGEAVYWHQPEAVAPPAHVAAPAIAWASAGTGWLAYPDALPTGSLTTAPALLHPEAQDILALGLGEMRAGRGLAPEALQPVYLRPAV